MSVLGIISWARAQSVERDLTATQGHVLLLLATYADAEGECWPSIATLARAASRGPSVVSAALAELRDLGLIERYRRGPGRSAVTRVMSDVSELKIAYTPEVSGEAGLSGTCPAGQDDRPAGGLDQQPVGREISDQPEGELNQPNGPIEEPLERLTSIFATSSEPELDGSGVAV